MNALRQRIARVIGPGIAGLRQARLQVGDRVVAELLDRSLDRPTHRRWVDAALVGNERRNRVNQLRPVTNVGLKHPQIVCGNTAV